MSLIDDHSCECSTSPLELFTLPPTQTSVQRGIWTEYPPVTALTDDSPIEFYVAGSGEEYVDLMNSYIHLKARIVKGDGTPLSDADSKGTPVNLWLQSLFSQVDVHLNDRLVSGSSNTYPYRAMLETLLHTHKETSQSQSRCGLFYKDTAGQMDMADADVANFNELIPGFNMEDDKTVDPTRLKGNHGLHSRYLLSRGSQVVDMVGPIHCDLFRQEKYLLNGVNMKIKMSRHKPSFCLMSTQDNPDYKIQIQGASLFIRRVKVSDGIIMGHGEALSKTNAKYPIDRVACKVLSIPAGHMTCTQDNVFLGQLPKSLVICMVDNDAFSGSYKKNPFNFQTYNLDHLALYVDGEQIPSKPLKPELQMDAPLNYMRCYESLFSGSAKLHGGASIISREDWPRGYALYSFDLTPDLGFRDHFSLIKQGNLRIELHFAKALARTINLIVYAEFDNVIEVTQNRSVIFDYTS